MSAGSGKFFLTLITVSISFAAFSLGAAHLRSDPADTMHPDDDRQWTVHPGGTAS